MDGLVSTGNEFPDTILEIIFFNQKIFHDYFINILKCLVDKGRFFYGKTSMRRSNVAVELQNFIQDDNHTEADLLHFSNSNNPG